MRGERARNAVGSARSKEQFEIVEENESVVEDGRRGLSHPNLQEMLRFTR